MTVDDLITALIALGKPNAKVEAACEMTHYYVHPVVRVFVDGEGRVVVEVDDLVDVRRDL